MVHDPHYDAIHEALRASKDAVAGRIRLAKLYFHRTLSCLTDDDSDFRPAPGMLTVFGQVFHVTMGLEPFTAGLFGPFEGIACYSQAESLMDLRWMDHQDVDVFESEPDAYLMSYFTPELLDVLAERRLSLALNLFDRAMDTLEAKFCAAGPEHIMNLRLPDNPLFPAEFTAYHLLDMMIEHAALHRGALSTYARLLGRSPPQPWMAGRAVKERQREMLLSRAPHEGAALEEAAE